MKPRNFILLALGAVATVVAWKWLRPGIEAALPLSASYEVRRANLLVSVTEDGALKALNEVSIRSNLEGINRIIHLAAEGTHVKEGDLLVELDASDLKDRITEQELAYQDGLFNFLQAEEGLKIQKNVIESNLKAAELQIEFSQSDLEKYRDGDAPQQIKNAEASIQIMLEDARIAEERAIRTEELVKRGNATKTELEADQLSSKRRKIQLDQSRENLRLLIKFTQPNTLRQLESNVQQAKDEYGRLKVRSAAEIAQVEADLRTAKSALAVMEVSLNQQKRQLEYAKIRAPQDGFVVYAALNQSGRGQGRGGDLIVQQSQRGRGRGGDGGFGRGGGGFGGQGGGFGGGGDSSARGRRERGGRGGGLGGGSSSRTSGSTSGGLSTSTGQGASSSSLGSSGSSSSSSSRNQSSSGSSVRSTTSTSSSSGQSSSLSSSPSFSSSSGSSLNLGGQSLSSGLGGLSQISYSSFDGGSSSRNSSSSLLFDDNRGPSQNSAIEEGALVRQRQELIKLPDISKMFAEVKVHESHVRQVHPGLTAYVKVETLPGQRFKGTVRRVGVVPDAQEAWLNANRRVYATEVLIEDELPYLKPGVSARAEIIVTNLVNVLTVPVQSVARLGDQNVCYVVAAGKPKAVPVTVGWSNDQFSEVIAGLKEGDRVLLAPPEEKESKEAKESLTQTNQTGSASNTVRRAESNDGRGRDSQNLAPAGTGGQRRNRERTDSPGQL